MSDYSKPKPLRRYGPETAERQVQAPGFKHHSDEQEAAGGLYMRVEELGLQVDALPAPEHVTVPDDDLQVFDAARRVRDWLTRFLEHHDQPVKR